MSFSTILQNLWKILSQYWDVFLIKGLSITLLLSVLTVFFGIPLYYIIMQIAIHILYLYFLITSSSNAFYTIVENAFINIT